ncbi:MAG: carboxypeptidase regulatory-like domain-containing protein [Candidatus Eisenbacteria bacterium]
MRTTAPILLILASLTTPVHAGVIRGSVRVPGLAGESHTFQPYAGKASSLPGHTQPARGLVTDAVLSIEALPVNVAATLPGQRGIHQLAQRDQSFVPRVMSVAVGTEVDFPNQDPIYHNVFSVSPPARFDLGKYPRGQSRCVRMAKPGLVKVFCDIHADMAAFVMVLPNRAFSRPSEDGAFRLPELPAGHYTMKWWHPDFTGGKREITVPASGDVSVDVVF